MSEFSTKTEFSLKDIKMILPHRYPLLLIDRIVKIIPGKSITSIKNITFNEPYFQGHFPGQPVLPGVYIIEFIAQTGAFLLLNTLENPLEKNAFISAVDGLRFRKTIIPGDQVKIEVTIAKRKLNICKFHGHIFVDDNLMAEGFVSANIVNRVTD